MLSPVTFKIIPDHKIIACRAVEAPQHDLRSVWYKQPLIMRSASVNLPTLAIHLFMNLGGIPSFLRATNAHLFVNRQEAKTWWKTDNSWRKKHICGIYCMKCVYETYTFQIIFIYCAHISHICQKTMTHIYLKRLYELYMERISDMHLRK